MKTKRKILNWQYLLRDLKAMKQKQERLCEEKPATTKKDEAAATVGYVACGENGKRTKQKIKIERSCSNDDEGIDDEGRSTGGRNRIKRK